MDVNIYALALVLFIGAATPGPDFLIVFRNSTIYGTKAGLFTTIGIVCGLFFHVLLVSFGIGLLLKNRYIYIIFELLASVYLLYIAYRLFRAKKVDINLANLNIKSKYFIKDGFFVNILNAKATIFISVIYSQFINSKIGLFTYVMMGLTVVLTAFVWFNILSLIVNISKIKNLFVKSLFYIEKGMGVLLVIVVVLNIYELMLHYLWALFSDKPTEILFTFLS